MDADKEDWIITQKHHESIIDKEKFEKVQELLNKTNKVNKNDEIDLFAGLLICNECDSSFTIKKTKDHIYYYCSNYVRNKKCTKHGINKQKLEEKVLKEINKKHHEITKLDRKILNELVDIIYISENKEIKIKFK